MDKFSFKTAILKKAKREPFLNLRKKKCGFLLHMYNITRQVENLSPDQGNLYIQHAL